jgi:subfamily B ATP-binding cassette protein MsbA
MIKNLAPLKALFPYVRPYGKWLVLSLLMAIPLAFVRFGPVALVKYFVDDLLIQKDRTKLLILPLSIIGIFVANIFVRFFHYFSIRFVVTKVGEHLRRDLYFHISGLSADYFTEKSVGEYHSRISQDPYFVEQGLAVVHNVVREPATFLVLFGYAFYLNPKLAVLTILLFPALAIIFAATGKHVKRYVRKFSVGNSILASQLQDALSGAKTVTQFGLQQEMRRRVKGSLENQSKTMLKITAWEEMMHPMVELLNSFIIALVIWYGGLQVIDNRMTQGELLAFFTAFGMMIQPMRLLSEVNAKLYQAAGAMERILETMSWKSRIVNKPSPKPIHDLKEEIHFENISFAYPGDADEHAILRDLDFRIKKGTKVALVGPSGSGKTTITSLMTRLYDVSKGRVLLDGVDIRDYDIRDIRKLFSVVSQDVFLFNDTVLENIRAGNDKATLDEIREAARKAHALEFIDEMPEGFNTPIGERGQKLSGGERQRLSIARSILKNSPILILDEATSHLDNTSERLVQEALESLLENRTALIIAHRLSTIKGADEILVLKDGVLMERGTHDQLLKSEGLYHRLSFQS